MSNTVTIASCHWRDLTRTESLRPLTRESGGFMHRFSLPAPEDRRSPSILVVEPMNEKVGVVEDFTVPKVVSAAHIAADLVAGWASGGEFSQYGGPAVWVCKGPKPTPDEIAKAIKRAELWCGAGVNQAQNYWIKGERDKVNDLHREMAAWLGKNDFEWIKRQAAVELVACPFCQQQIPSTASVCSNCGRVANPRLLAQTEAALKAIAAEEEKLQTAVREFDPDADFTPVEAAIPPELLIEMEAQPAQRLGK